MALYQLSHYKNQSPHHTFSIISKINEKKHEYLKYEKGTHKKETK